MNDNETPQHSTAQEAMYAEMAAMDNQDEPLENYSDRLVGALYRAGFAIIPVVLPADALGEAAVSGAASTGNPKHLWDFLILRVMVKPLPSDAVICKNEKTESDDALMLRVAKEEIKRQAAEIERLKARLEVSPDHPYDGIASRDATIKLMEGRIAELQAQYDCNTAIMHARTDAMNKRAARAAELEQDAARYRYIRTHRIGVKWCELYAGGPALDGVIDEMMTEKPG